MLLTRSEDAEVSDLQCLGFPALISDFDIYNVIHYNPAGYNSGRSVIRSFSDHGTEDVFNQRRTKAARGTCPEQLWRVAQRKLDQLNAAVSLASL